MAHEPTPTQEELLLESFLALKTPEGFKAELIEGEIVVSPAPDGEHEDYLSTVIRQVLRQSRTDMDSSGNKGLLMRSGGLCPKNHVIPDVTFAPRELRLFRGAPSWMPCAGVAMVVEVTSTRADVDRIAKRHCYARAGIPLYLLVDREQGTVTLHSDPSGEDFGDAHSTAFGKSLPLPPPFSFDLETSEFA
ncbi:Uma2 family endonuclease [Streptomyces sp. ISL-11]|uniref:Uma2 family endonuclease n=1 Tax=Streptomyces sp. ISL-11 TaxID=2819174 RepID=UPI001BEAF1F3|nr:Uma2 family endonuclease [Streptomyces sp. ISL-11]MBT2384097.1 Uma2 family endonuclease [Streptomyces sp. ISL-11]